MAVESLNKVLKCEYNKMNGNRNIRIEKLLDLLEELVHEQMWKRIINEERSNSNSYQHKESVELGKFKVKSSSGNKFYNVFQIMNMRRKCIIKENTTSRSRYQDELSVFGRIT